MDFLFYMRSAFCGKAVLEYTAEPYKLMRLCKGMDQLMRPMRPREDGKIHSIKIPYDVEPTKSIHLMPFKFKNQLISDCTPNAPPIKLLNGWFITFPTKFADLDSLKTYLKHMPNNESGDFDCTYKCKFVFIGVELDLYKKLEFEDIFFEDQEIPVSFDVELAVENEDFWELSIIYPGDHSSSIDIQTEDGWKAVEILLSSFYQVSIFTNATRMLPEIDSLFKFVPCDSKEEEKTEQKDRYYICRRREERYKFVRELNEKTWKLTTAGIVTLQDLEEVLNPSCFVYDSYLQRFKVMFHFGHCKKHRKRLAYEHVCFEDATRDNLPELTDEIGSAPEHSDGEEKVLPKRSMSF